MGDRAQGKSQGNDGEVTGDAKENEYVQKGKGAI